MKAPPFGRRRIAAVLLVLAVAVIHGCIAAHLADNQLGLGADDAPVRMEVDFVRELVQQAPPRAAPMRKKPHRPAAAAATPEPTASAPEPAASAAAAPVPDEPASAVDSLVAAAPIADLPASAAAPGHEWPPSTRLTYDMTGDYRGPVEGTAKVQWIRSGTHYQVHLDVLIGPAMAPLATVRLTSDGALTEAGLKPKSYLQESKVAFGEPRRRTLSFEDDHIVMVDGSHKPPLPGVQDAVSQLVQLGWIFAMRPELLQAGQSVEVPLALGRRVDAWRYDVLPSEELDTPMGKVLAWPVRPSQADGGGNPALKIESWIAPSMQYLPVRIHVDIDNGAHMDLKLSGKPMQAP